MQQKYKHSFTDSKMQKDLDARLVSPSEYRDAVNVSVSRSEGGDVGALENILGNEIFSNFSAEFTHPAEIIGWAIDQSDDRIFVFVTDFRDNSDDRISDIASTNSIHKIIYVNTLTGAFSVIVQGSFLNFSTSSPIYHTSMIENLLFWTDNRNQPRQINVDTAIADTTYYTKEEHISVAKYYPYKPIELYTEYTIDNAVFLDQVIEGRTPPVGDVWLGYDAIYPYFMLPDYEEGDVDPVITALTSNLGVRAYIIDGNGDKWEFKITWFQYDGQNLSTITTKSDPILPAPYGDPLARKYLIFIDRDLTSASLTKYTNAVPPPADPIDLDTYKIVFQIENARDVSNPWRYDDVGKYSVRLLGSTIRIGDPADLPADAPTVLYASGNRSFPYASPVRTTGLNAYSAYIQPPEEPGGAGKSLSIFTIEDGFPTNNTGSVGANDIWPRIKHPKIPETEYVVIASASRFPLVFGGLLTAGTFNFTTFRYTALSNGGTLQVYPLANYGLVDGDIITIHNPNKYYKHDFPGDPKFLEDKFVRFSYRYKFDNGEYSLLAPFTQAVFKPKQGGYFLKEVNKQRSSSITATNPYINLIPQEQLAGETSVVDFMTNSITEVDVTIPLEFPANQLANQLKVNEIDIVYKESDSLALKVVKTLSIEDYATVTDNKITYQYQSQKPIKVLPDSEITRVYDNVPIRAATQASSGNRVIYGNFYDRHTSPLSLDYLVGVGRKLTQGFEENTKSTVSLPNHTLKQNRSYQVGFILADKYGRQSDVILAKEVDTSIIENSGLFANQPITFGADTVYSPYFTTESYNGPLVFGPITPQADIKTTQNTVAGIVDWPGNSLKVKMTGEIPNTITTNEGYPSLYEAIQTELTIFAASSVSGYRRLTWSTPPGDGRKAQPGMVIKFPNGTVSEPISHVDITNNYIYLPLTSPYQISATPAEIVKINELGWYSYKIVVKQTEQEYYNIYLASLVAGNPVVKPFSLDISVQTSGIGTVNSTISHPAAQPRTFLLLEGMVFENGGTEYVITNILNDENFTVSPAPGAALISQVVTFTTKVQNDLIATTLLADNPNKIPPALNEVTSVQQQYSTSDTRLIPRVAYNQFYGTSTLAGGEPYFPNPGPGDIKRNTQIFPGNISEKVRALGNFFNIFTDASPAGLYEAKTDPMTAVVENTFSIGVPSEDIKPDSVEPLLFSCYETTPVKSNIEIYWETSTSGNIYDLNKAYKDNIAAGGTGNIIEVDYFNSMWLKRVLSCQTIDQLPINSTVPDGGVGSGCDLGVWPLTNVYAPPLTSNVPDDVNTAGGSITGAKARGMTAPNDIGNDQSIAPENFYLEEARIRGGFNDTSLDFAARAYLDEDEPIQQHRFNALIYSGVFNSRTGINRTNEFPTGKSITKAANPDNGSIQKLYAEENNLLVLQEDKCNRALIDKDAIYSAEGGGTVTSSNTVIGEIVPYAGEYGISRNPESFAIYGFRKYFADRNRSAILRLSHDGITEISEYGMRDWFRDNLSTLTDNYTNTYTINLEVLVPPTPARKSFFRTTAAQADLEKIIIGSEVQTSTNGGVSYSNTNLYVIEIDAVGGYIYLSGDIDVPANLSSSFRFVNKFRSRIVGGWDIYNKQYVPSLQYNYSNAAPYDPGTRDNTYYTLGFDEVTGGWTSFYTYRPGQLGSAKNKVFTTNNIYSSAYTTGSGNLGVYMQYSNNVPRGEFYGADNPSTITFIANPNPSVQKNFLTIDYEGNSGWKVVSIDSDETGFEREYAGGVPLANWKLYIDETNQVYSYEEGAYDSLGNTGLAASPANYPLLHAGFDRKENRYVANLVNNSSVMPGEIIFGDQMSGIKGYFATIQMSTDSATDPGGYKELYTVGFNYSISSM